MAELVESCRLKLKRAKAHLEELQGSIECWREKSPYTLVRDEERKGDIIVWTYSVTRVKVFPDDWAILTGEILYQCHSALDHLAGHLASLKSAPEDPEDVTFPIWASKAKFWQRNKCGCYRQGRGAWMTERMIDGAEPLVVDVQPYRCKDKPPEHHWLWRLHVLSNEDKHKTLHVAHAAATKSRVKRTHVEGLQILGPLNLINRKPFDQSAESIATLHVRITAPKARIDIEPGLLFEEVFGPRAPEPVRGLPVWKTLVGIYNYIAEDVFRDRFDPFLEGL